MFEAQLLMLLTRAEALWRPACKEQGAGASSTFVAPSCDKQVSGSSSWYNDYVRREDTKHACTGTESGSRAWR